MVRILVSAIATEVLLALIFLTRAAANAACTVARSGAPCRAKQRQRCGASRQQQIAGIFRRSAPGHLLDVLGLAVVVVMIVMSHVVVLQRILTNYRNENLISWPVSIRPIYGPQG